MPDYNKPAFYAAERQIKKQGHKVKNPARLPLGKPFEWYMARCFKQIDCCDTVYFLAGWERSKGARLELDYAIQHGKNLEFEVR
jgi:hypothetical protein